MISVMSAGIITGSGLVAGFLTGLVSLGGAFIVVPAVYESLMLAGLDSHSAFTTAVVTSIAFILVSSSSASLTYFRKKLIDYRILAIVSVSAIGGVVVGSDILLNSDDQPIRFGFGIFIWCLGAFLLYFRANGLGRRYADKLPDYTFGNQIGIAVVSGGVGLLVALFGIGGGGVISPAMAILFRADMKRSVATGVAATFIISAAGLLVYLNKNTAIEMANLEYSLGWLYLPALLFLVPCAILAAPLGARVATHLSNTALLTIVTAAMFFIGARFVFL